MPNQNAVDVQTAVTEQRNQPLPSALTDFVRRRLVLAGLPVATAEAAVQY